jgi:hypothetical protein
MLIYQRVIVFYGLSLIRCENPVGNSGVLGGPRLPCVRIAMDVFFTDIGKDIYGILWLFVDIC